VGIAGLQKHIIIYALYITITFIECESCGSFGIYHHLYLHTYLFIRKWSYRSIRVIPPAIRPEACSKYNSTRSIQWYAEIFRSPNYDFHIFRSVVYDPKNHSLDYEKSKRSKKVSSKLRKLEISSSLFSMPCFTKSFSPCFVTIHDSHSTYKFF